MRVSTVIADDGVTTEVIRTFEATAIESRNMADEVVGIHETPALATVATAVAQAAVAAHRLTIRTIN
ncbi:hypothetical protein SEA_FIZZLES_60 [Microbacterium phage Fizzles]|nr:hypothetical protein SEA_FIZZLES_60 [Microbacterium phage Fizzles]